MTAFVDYTDNDLRLNTEYAIISFSLNRVRPHSVYKVTVSDMVVMRIMSITHQLLQSSEE